MAFVRIAGGPDMTERSLQPGRDGARAIVREAMTGYLAARRERIGPFVDRHFSLAGSAALHRNALGWDLLRAPANLLLVVPNTGVKLAAAGLEAAGMGRAATRLRATRLLLSTRVGREVHWLVMTEFLELPCRDGDRVSTHDALAEAVLSHPTVQALAEPVLASLASRAGDMGVRRRLEQSLSSYVDTRVAAAEIATAMLSLGGGAATVHKMTPGMVTLGSALAAALAQQSAIAAFPLGATLGSVWYTLFPATASSMLVAGVTGGLMMGAAALSAFAGIVTDPVQRRLGIHRRRLERLVLALEREWLEGRDGRFGVREHYVARLLDLFDLLAAAWRVVQH
jgi:hypothetical protein